MCRIMVNQTILLSDNKKVENQDWSKAMKEEIQQIEKNKTQTLVPRPGDKNVIGTKWVYRNKLDKKW